MMLRRTLLKSGTVKALATRSVLPVVKPKASLSFTALTATALTAALTAKMIAPRLRDKIPGSTEFDQHTKAQLKAHPFSGMHQNFRTKNSELLTLFNEHYAQDFGHLFPETEELKKRQAVESPVRIRPLAESPVPFDAKNSVTLGIGGPPALISLTKHHAPTYINDESGWPIINGSAFHLEYDRPTEAPSSRQPIEFVLTQIARVVNYQSFDNIAKTNSFTWSSLDWEAWLKHPKEWPAAFKLFFEAQRNALGTPERQNILDNVVKNCRYNEGFYDRLNTKLNGKLLVGKSSVIIARTPDEVAELKALDKDLAKDGQSLTFMTREQHIAEFGYAPKGLLFAKKAHDRVLAPNFKKIISTEITRQGGSVIDGKVTQIFTTGTEAVVEYQTPAGKKEYVSSQNILMSLGKQQVLDAQNKPLFDTVSARGVSFLALAFLPEGCTHPAVAVYGGTNHATCVGEPKKVMRNGKLCNMQLLRITGGATIAPRNCGEDSVRYDGSIAFGIMNAVKTALDAEVVELETFGCGRSITKNMFMKWGQTPSNALKVQLGAGGGGATNGPLGALDDPEQRVSLGRPRK